jgi:cysteinyl-tRNA synthetase
LAATLVFLGLFTWEELEGRVAEMNKVRAILSQLEERLQGMRVAAQATKDFSDVDKMKTKLAAANVSVMMTKDAVNLRPEVDASIERLERLL